MADVIPLYLLGKKVAEGRVHNFERHHNSTVPEGMVVVSIVNVLDAQLPLPIPEMEIEKMGEAVGTFVLWYKKDIAAQLDRHEEACTPPGQIKRIDWQDRGNEGLASNETNHVQGLSRDELVEKACTLMHECCHMAYAYGVIVFADPNHAVSDVKLGEGSIAATIMNIFPMPEKISMRCQACAEMPQLHDLVRWPIDLVLVDNIPVCTLVVAVKEKDVENEPYSIRPEIGITKKRPYSMVNRRPRTRPAQSKCEIKTSAEAILDFRSSLCCMKRCCANFTSQEIACMRTFYWNMKSSERTTFAYNMLDLCSENGVVRKLMLNNKQVCVKAWHKAYGIPISTFYKWKKLFNDGHRIAEHGNTGSKKPRSHTLAGNAVLSMFIDENAETMPHRSKITSEGSRQNVKRLHSVLTKKDIHQEVDISVTEMTGKHISPSSFLSAWKENHSEVSIAKRIAFSKCNTCIVIKEKLAKTRDPNERRVLAIERKSHMTAQISCRSLYWSWRALSHRSPEHALTIIHDKMDQNKTMVPRLEKLAKSVWRGERLKVSVTGALMHGHGIGALGHFSLDLWPDDSNFHVGSLNHTLKTLENKSEDNWGHLRDTDRPESSWGAAILNTDNLRTKMMNGSRNDFMPPIKGPMVANKLPRRLYLQLDNCSGQNKNRYLFSYLSYLVWLGVFDQVQLGFMMVGHTHDDIDALFGNYSTLMRRSDALTIPELMQLFRQCSSKAPSPYLVTEVPDWKEFVKGFIPDKKDRLCGHLEPLLFKFCMKDGWPLMFYKMRPGHREWLPEKGIRMWKEDAQGLPMIPRGSPKVLQPYGSLKDIGALRASIAKYMMHWAAISRAGDKSWSNTYMNEVIDYWSTLLRVLGDVQPGRALIQDFWPSTRQSALEEPERVFVDEHIEASHYVGPFSGRPKNPVEIFDPYQDVKKGMLLLIRPHDNCPTWMGFAEEDPIEDPNLPHYEEVFVSWFEPIARKGTSYAMQYRDCWSKNWRPNPNDPPRYQPLKTIDYGWAVETRPLSVVIPSSVRAQLQELVAKEAKDDDENS